MASPNFLPNGIGGLTGAALALASPLLTSGSVWYVHSGTGRDGATYGKDRLTPLATLEYCMGTMAYASHDIVVLMSGHTETPAASIDIGVAGTKHGISVIGEGTGANMPRLVSNIDDELLAITGNDITVSNVYFPEATLDNASGTGKIEITGFDVVVDGCRFECGVLDRIYAMHDACATAGRKITIRDTSFVSVAPDSTVLPALPVRISPVTTAWLDMDNVTCDGGNSAWNAYGGAISINSACVVHATNIKLLNGSDINLVTGCTGYINVSQATGSSKVVWTA